MANSFAHWSAGSVCKLVSGRLMRMWWSLHTRILRGTKAAGRAEQNKTQHCYYALLKVGSEFHYAALQHLHYHGAPYIPIEWCEDVGFSGHGPSALAKQMAGFKPKSVSAVAKSAAKFASKSPSLKRKALKAQPEQSARACSKAVESDLESDESDGRESPDESVEMIDNWILWMPERSVCVLASAWCICTLIHTSPR